MTILLTAASGRTTRYVLKELLPSTTDVRLAVRTQASIDSLKQAFPKLTDAHFVVVQNALDVDALAKACAGVDVVFYNATSFISTETAMGIVMVDAAMKAGVKHFMYCGVLHPFLTKLVNHLDKLPVQEYLTESGLDYTVLQPTSMMQNLDIRKAAATGTLGAMYTTSVVQGFVDLQDIAVVAAQILLDPQTHAYAAYELTGYNCTLDDVAKILEKEMEQSESETKSVEVVKLPREKVVDTYCQAKGTTDYYGTDGLERMLFYYDKRGIPGNLNTLRWLLNREPTTWAGYIRKELKLKNSGEFHMA